MTIDDIMDSWGEDSKIDFAEVGRASLEVAKLHHKYYSMLTREKLIYHKIESDLKTLKLEKYEFYTDGPTYEQIEKGWKLPPKGRLLKGDAKEYVEADSDVISCTLKLAYQREKIEALDSIIKTIHQMNWNVRNFIEWEKFKAGVI